MVSKIWVGMFTTNHSNIHLSQFKIQSHLQKRELLNVRYNRTHTAENLSKTSNITFAILPFSHKNAKIIILSTLEYFGVYASWWNHQMRFKMVCSNTKNAKSRVCQYHVCYSCTTHSSALNEVIWTIYSIKTDQWQ